MENKFRKMNDKAKYHLDQLLMEMHITSYAEGYEAGKVVTETWSNANPVLVKSVEEIEYEGVKYRKVKRTAKKGEFVTYNYNGKFNNIPKQVQRSGNDGVEFFPSFYYVNNDDDEVSGYAHDAYDVLEPIEEKVSPILPQKTPNQQRAELIQKAKEFVEGIIGSYDTFSMTVDSKRNQQMKPVFHTNENKRAVTVLIYGGFSKKLYFKGVAKCNPSDVFNEWIGKAIALARALEIDIPVEFLEAIQPEFAIGQVVKAKSFETGRTMVETIKAFETVYGEKCLKVMERGYFVIGSVDGWEYNPIIIDDSNAQYGIKS